MTNDERDHAIDILRRVPGWADMAFDGLRRMEPGGATNRSYRFEVAGVPYVLRVSDPNAALLGIDRATEFAAHAAAEAAGVATRVVYAFLPEGHQVRHFEEGTEWTWDDLRRPEVVDQLVDVLRVAHRAGEVPASASPFRDIERRLQRVRELGLPLRPELPDLLHRAEAVERRFWLDQPTFRGLCHFDAFVNNFLATPRGVVLMDWEFAGMGDVYYDLACVGCLADEAGQRAILRRYFGEEPDDDALLKFDAIRWASRVWNWTWALLQCATPHAQPLHAQYERDLFNAAVAQQWRW